MAKIWIPDNSNLLLGVIGRSLRRAGHSVVSCSSPEFAIGRRRTVRGEDNLLIVDLNSVENREIVFLMLKIRIPNLKVLFISEQSSHPAEEKGPVLLHAIAPGERHVLRVPFTNRELLNKVGLLLAGQAGKAAGATGQV